MSEETEKGQYMSKAKNINGGNLSVCCTNPMTGFFRDGHCNTNHLDQGTHVVCAVMTDEFLQFSKSRGNDLITPNPQYQFPGLKAGDGWCLCITRWKEAHDNGVAPPIKANATHERALEFVPLDILMSYNVE